MRHTLYGIKAENTSTRHVRKVTVRRRGSKVPLLMQWIAPAGPPWTWIAPIEGPILFTRKQDCLVPRDVQLYWTLTAALDMLGPEIGI